MLLDVKFFQMYATKSRIALHIFKIYSLAVISFEAFLLSTLEKVSQNRGTASNFTLSYYISHSFIYDSSFILATLVCIHFY